MSHRKEAGGEQSTQRRRDQLEEWPLLRQLAKGAMVFGSRNVVQFVSDFISALLLIRLLPVEDYARLTLVLSARGMAGAFLDLGLGSFITVEIARCHGQGRLDRVKRFLLRYSQLNLLIGGALLALGMAAQWSVRRLLSPLTAWLVLIVGIDLFVTAWRHIARTTFYGYSRFTYMGGIDILESVFKLGLIALLLVGVGVGLRSIVVVYPLSTAMALLFVSPEWVRIIGGLRHVSASRDPVFRKGLRGPGKWVVLARPLKQVRDELPIWLIQWVLGKTGVALYAVAKKGYNYTALALTPLEELLLPLVSENIDDDQQIADWLIHRAGKYSLIGVGFLIVVGLLFSPLVYDLVFQYPAAASTYRILLLTLPLRALAFYQRPMFYALQGQKYLVAVMGFSILVLGVSVGLGSLWFGVVGAAIGLLINLSLTIVVRHRAIQRLRPDFQIAWRSFFCIDETDRRLFVEVRDRLLARLRKS